MIFRLLYLILFISLVNMIGGAGPPRIRNTAVIGKVKYRNFV